MPRAWRSPATGRALPGRVDGGRAPRPAPLAAEAARHTGDRTLAAPDSRDRTERIASWGQNLSLTIGVRLRRCQVRCTGKTGEIPDREAATLGPTGERPLEGRIGGRVEQDEPDLGDTCPRRFDGRDGDGRREIQRVAVDPGRDRRKGDGRHPSPSATRSDSTWQRARSPERSSPTSRRGRPCGSPSGREAARRAWPRPRPWGGHRGNARPGDAGRRRGWRVRPSGGSRRRRHRRP